MICARSANKYNGVPMAGLIVDYTLCLHFSSHSIAQRVQNSRLVVNSDSFADYINNHGVGMLYIEIYIYLVYAMCHKRSFYRG